MIVVLKLRCPDMKRPLTVYVGSPFLNVRSCIVFIFEET